jgi:tetratricopeptide (TPR) repeat protein
MVIHQAKADLYLLVSDFMRAWTEWEHVLTLARRLGDRLTEGIALVGMSQASFWGHQFDRALVDARQAIEIAQSADSQLVLAGAHLTTGLVYQVTGRLDEAMAELERTLTLSQSIGDATNAAVARIFMAEFKGWEGKFAEAVHLYSEGLRLARTHNVLMPLLEGLFMCGIALTGQGSYDEALAMFEEGLALAEKVGDANFSPRYLNSLGWLHIECGSLDRAGDLNQRAAAGGRDRGDHESIANAELNLGDIFLMKGDLVLAQEMLDSVHHLVRDPATSDWMRWRYSMHLCASLGELWLARGDPTRAQEFVAQCLDIATRTNSRKYVVKGWRLQGEIARARRQWDEAEGWLRQALPLAQTVGNPPQLWKTHLALGHLHAAARRPDPAQQAYQDARAVIERVKVNIQNPKLRASLEHSPLIQQVYDVSPSS